MNNDFTEETDIDLAVIKNITLSQLTTLLNRLEKYSPTDCDNAKQKLDKPVFQYNINNTFHQLFRKN
jgi:hypothetical protein